MRTQYAQGVKKSGARRQWVNNKVPCLLSFRLITVHLCSLQNCLTVLQRRMFTFNATQLLLHCKPPETVTTLLLLLNDVWMMLVNAQTTTNRPKLNSDETEILWIGTINLLITLTSSNLSVSMRCNHNNRQWTSVGCFGHYRETCFDCQFSVFLPATSATMCGCCWDNAKICTLRFCRRCRDSLCTEWCPWSSPWIHWTV